MSSIDQICNAILSGGADGEFDAVIQAVRLRRDAIAVKSLRENETPSPERGRMIREGLEGKHVWHRADS